jgi:L-lactate dehydrogenase complex protein LldG
MAARDEILARIRSALGDAPAPPPLPPPVPGVSLDDPLDRLEDRLVDYKAVVTRCVAGDLGQAIGVALDGVDTVVVPDDAPPDWLAGYPGTVLRDEPGTDLDTVGAVLTGCAVVAAETGTIILDAGVAQGRRALSLIPDHHVCVVRADQVLPDVGDAVARLAPSSRLRPLTWISGPSATSDIELNRVEGVHGPRRLHVILVTE